MRILKASMVILVRLLVLGFLLVSLLSLPQTTVSALDPVYVSPSGSGVACTQAVPCALGQGLSSVDPGGTLYAMQGTYLGSGAEVVLLDKAIDFLGGWSGNSSGPVERDASTYESILDGEDERRGITITGAAEVDPLVDGWTIRNGLGNNILTCLGLAGSASGCGGGIYVNTAQPILSNNIIQGNTGTTPGGTGTGLGGGIYVIYSLGTIIHDNDIYGNDAHIDGKGYGGGIALVETGIKTSVLDNLIHENEGASSELDIHAGHAIYILSNDSQVQIHGNQIYDNNPNDLDPDYFVDTIHTQYCDSTCVIDENQIINNHGRSAITVSYASTTIQQNTINNPDVAYGIAIYATDTIPHDPGVAARVVNNILAGHSAYNVRITGLIGEENHTQMIHNTLAGPNGGVLIDNIDDAGEVLFDRGIVSDHSVCGICILEGLSILLNVSNTLFYGNSDDGVTGINPLGGDPLYVNPGAGDFHIAPGSAAINRVTDGGLVYEDIDKDIRPSGGTATPFDVGADEFFWLSVYLPATIKP